MLEANDLRIDKIDREVKENDDKNTDGDAAGNGAAGVADLSPEIYRLLISPITKGDCDKGKPQRLQKAQMLTGEHAGDGRLLWQRVRAKDGNKQEQDQQKLDACEDILYTAAHPQTE